MHLLPSVATQPNLELKTQPKQFLGSLPLVIALPALSNCGWKWLPVTNTLAYHAVVLNAVVKKFSYPGPRTAITGEIRRYDIQHNDTRI